MLLVVEGNMDICDQFYGNPLTGCQDISLKTTSNNLMLAVEEKSEDHRRSPLG